MKSWIDTPLPEGWKLSKNCEYCTILSGFPFSSTGFNTDGIGTPIVRIRDITSGHTETFYKGDFPISSLIENGDLLVGMDGDFNHCIWKSGRAILNQRCCKILCKNEWYKKYISYVLPFQLKLINELKNSTTVKHLNNTDILTASLPIPTDINILKRTVCFLDRNCNAVDRLVANMREKLLKLSEYRQSLITQAVTKGLDPNVEMKDSGVEWIGHIPQSWSVPQVKYLFSVVCGATPSPSESNWGGDIAWIGPSDMEDAGMIDHGARFLTSIGYKSCGTELVPVGSLILSTRAPIGKVAYACRELCTNQGCKSLVPRQNIETKYFYYVLQAMRSLLEKEGSGTTFMELSTSSLGSQKLPLPSNKEQIAIADYLDKKLKQLQITLDTTKKSIDRLTEYRTSLISAAVTGKIDINEVK